MRCLWLTLCDPDPPVNGQFLYSSGLIRAAAGAGLDLTVVGLPRDADAPKRRNENGVDWIFVEDCPASRLSRICSPLPMLVTRSQVPEMEQTVEALLVGNDWDAIVLDSIACGWLLRRLLAYRARRQAKIVYLSHNHETTVGRYLANAAHGVRKAYKALDAAKIASFERRLARAADLVTANTPEDCEKFSAMIDGETVPFLPPGYGGPRVEVRRIGRHLPRRAVVVGSFDWPPKRLSIEAFLMAASGPLAESGVELQIVGSSKPSFLAGLRQRYPTIEFTGPVDDVRPYMAQARLALVPDQLGGFKLKSLDYVFNRLPIFAMDVAVPGTPMVDGSSIRLFPSHAALAQGVIDAIDDVEALDRQQELAFAACADCFDWHTIGRRLADHVRRLRQDAEPTVRHDLERGLARAS